MRGSNGRLGRRLRTVFVSDVHLGSRHSQARAFLSFLRSHQPDQLFIVGDFIDGWKLRRSWYWSADYNAIFERLLELAREGTRLYYTPGNHDEFLRALTLQLDFVDVADEFVFQAGDGRQYLVTHGDQFDSVECQAGWLAVVGAIGYEVLLSANRWLSRWCGHQSFGPHTISARVKRRVKRLVQIVSSFEQRVARHAVRRRCDGVICGHIHSPTIEQFGDVVYCNTGDWVESCTALVEYEGGELELLYFNPETCEQEWLPAGSPNPLPWRTKPEPALVSAD